MTDNGKVFTGRFGKPRPAEVLFERICRKNGIRQLLARPYSPTTIGKVERWHQTLQTDFLGDAGPFATIEAAQAAVDGWRHEYNHDRPHQSLGMATPASRFRLRSPEPDEALSLRAPADLELLTSPPPVPESAAAGAKPASWPDAVEVDRVVPPSGNLTVGPLVTGTGGVALLNRLILRPSPLVKSLQRQCRRHLRSTPDSAWRATDLGWTAWIATRRSDPSTGMFVLRAGRNPTRVRAAVTRPSTNAAAMTSAASAAGKTTARMITTAQRSAADRTGR